MLAGIAGTLAFRLRGDAAWHAWTGLGTSGGRLLWAAVTGLTGGLVSAQWQAGLACLATAYVAAIPGWRANLDMTGGKRNAIRLARRGLLWTGPVAAALWLTLGQGLWYAAVGAGLPVLYGIGWRLRSRRVRWLRDTGIAELLFGAWALGWLALAAG